MRHIAYLSFVSSSFFQAQERHLNKFHKNMLFTGTNVPVFRLLRKQHVFVINDQTARMDNETACI